MSGHELSIFWPGVKASSVPVLNLSAMSPVYDDPSEARSQPQSSLREFSVGESNGSQFSNGALLSIANAPSAGRSKRSRRRPQLARRSAVARMPQPLSSPVSGYKSR